MFAVSDTFDAEHLRAEPIDFDEHTTSYVAFRINERFQRICLWINQVLQAEPTLSIWLIHMWLVVLPEFPVARRFGAWQFGQNQWNTLQNDQFVRSIAGNTLVPWPRPSENNHREYGSGRQFDSIASQFFEHRALDGEQMKIHSILVFLFAFSFLLADDGQLSIR